MLTIRDKQQQADRIAFERDCERMGFSRRVERELRTLYHGRAAVASGRTLPAQQPQGLIKPDTNDAMHKFRTAFIYDHFMEGFSSSATGKWVTTGTTGSGASVAINTAAPAGGKLTFTTGATQNNIAQMQSAYSVFQFLSNQPQQCICNLAYTEGNVNLAGIAFGFASSWTNILANTTYALPTTLSGALIYKIPGGTYWNVFGSVGTTQYTQLTTAICQNAGTPQNMAIYAMMDSASNVELTFEVYGAGNTATPQAPWAYPSTLGMSRYQIAKFYIPYASAAAMQLGLFVISGDPGGTSEVVNLDLIGGGILSIP